MSDTVSPVVGKKYMTRSQGIVGPMEIPKGWDVSIGVSFGGKGWYKDGRYSHSGGHSLDLIQEIQDGPVRTVTRPEIIPGTYDGVEVGVTTSHNEVWVEFSGYVDFVRIERAISILTELAGALRSIDTPKYPDKK